MEEVDRKSEQSSEHSQDSSLVHRPLTSASIDQDLLPRVRTLLLSHNGQYLPKTPCPSSDFTSAPGNLFKSTTDNCDNDPKAIEFTTFKSSLKLVEPDSRRSIMVINKFDGPAGQLEDLTIDGPRRHPSHPSMQIDHSSNMGDATLHTAPGLNSRALGHLVGREHRESAIPALTEAKSIVNHASPRNQQYGSYKPKYVPKTVSPARGQQPDSSLRPSFPHVPGSYRSEISPNGEFNSDVTTLAASDHFFLTDHDFSIPKLTPQEQTYPPARAVEALSRVKQQDVPQPQYHPSTPPILSRPTLHEKQSSATLKSNNSAKRFHHLLFKPLADQFHSGSPVEPTLTFSQDYGHSHEDASQLPFHAPEDPPKRKESKPLATPITEHLVEVPVPGSKGAEPTTVIMSVLQISELLAKLPPFSGDRVSDHGASYITSKPSINSKRSSLQPKSSSEYSGRSSGYVARSQSVSSGLSQRGPRMSVGQMKDGQDKSNSVPAQTRTPEADAMSTLSQKVSTFSGAISVMSELSVRSGVRSPSVGSQPKYDRYDFENEASRLQKSPSLPSLGDSVTTNDTTDLERLAQQPRLMQKGSYQSPLSVIRDSRAPQPEPKYHWVKHLLGGRLASSIGSDPPTLTTRPHHRRRHAAEAAAKARSGTTPGYQIREAPGDGTMNHQLMNSDSTDTASAMRQQQKNTEAFTNVIQDLETLLREALSIAHQAADKDETLTAPDLIVKLPATAMNSTQNHDVLDFPSRKYSTNDRFSGAHERFRQSSSHGSLEPAVQLQYANHSGDHVIIVEPDAESRHQGHFRRVRDDTPYPGRSTPQSRNPSMVPTAETLHSTSEHARNTAAHLGLPDPRSRVELLRLQETQPPITHASDQITPDALDSIPSARGLVDQVTSNEVNDCVMERQSSTQYLENRNLQKVPRKPDSTKASTKEQLHLVIREHQSSPNTPSKEDVQSYIDVHKSPPIHQRISSAGLRTHAVDEEHAPEMQDLRSSDEESMVEGYIAEFHNPGLRNRAGTRRWPAGGPEEIPRIGPGALPHEDTITSLRDPRGRESDHSRKDSSVRKGYSLKDRHHFSIREPHGFSLSRSHRRAPIARDWTTTRKRLVAMVTCISTALMGLIIGIYAGEVPAIQYAIVDERHYTILGNVVFFIGLAIPTALFFPLPLLHGRKPYTLAALALLLPLQFPQAVAVESTRSPYVATYRVGLLLSRAFAGFVMGFANINFQATLLDLFGASLQSSNPHQETVNENDVRRHGGGMGIWLGIWTWCSIGSIGVGFLIGAVIISGLNVAWGFWITIILTAAVLLLNVLTPEVRRSPYRRSMAEVRSGSDISRRIARGEVKMHLYSTGPKYWWEEVVAGHVLCIRMLAQPGFLVLSLYLGWIYGQVVMVIVVRGRSVI